MIRVTFTPPCRELLEHARLSPNLATAALNERHQGSADRRGTRIVACHWFSDDLIVLVDSDVTRAEYEPEHGRIHVAEVTASVVLRLRPELPAGPIHRDMDLEQVLAVVAESFGIPLTCDPDEPFSTLYTGPGSKDALVVHTGCIPPEYWLLGSFDPHEAQCEFVWAFRPDRYRTWLEAAG